MPYSSRHERTPVQVRGAVPARIWHPAPVKQDADYDTDLTDRIEALLSAWVEPLGDRVAVERSHDDNEPGWALHPRTPTASPIWVHGGSAWVLTVGFGRSGSCVELGFSKKVTADDALSALDEIGRSVIAGRLVEWRRGKRGSRWRLTLPDGEVTQGAANWFLPLGWRTATEENFSPY